MSILLLFRRGGSSPSAAVIHGGHFLGRKQRRRFDDLERRRRLRQIIEDLIDEPIVLVNLAPYLHRPASAQAARPKLNWAKIYQNMDEIERKLLFSREIIEKERVDDDDEDMLGLM